MGQSAGEKSSIAAQSAKAAELALNMNTSHLAGSKLRKQLSGTLQEHASAPTSAFARKQLEKMGWSAGTGLGKKRDGIKTHIKVKKRKDQEGIGAAKFAAEHQASTEEWWKDSIGGTLAKLSAKNSKKGDKKKSKRKHFTDQELFEATGGARFGMRAAPTKNLHKWRRTESSENDDAPAKVSAGDDASDVKAAFGETTGSCDEDRVVKKAKKSKKSKKSKQEGAEAKKSRKEKKSKKKSKSSVDKDDE